ncbi:hypothetical protein Dalk_4602 [Desulfatibacillum aliphaticivorans]|uniref:DUF5405 domain-containing protein n=1 Tax=Desulfatibacillum aliphaticivorans TaxID=218208 RepID=B8FNJ9_DESAL|nr:hypothetical protein [Desulfatibacillum aliphaticivorans]ACL06280.1 hypothetical protein Dalk_4602 [Desulfatibacillum aliphaticivorans]
MQIPVGDKHRLEIDTHNVTIQELKTKGKDSKDAGETFWKNEHYYPTVAENPARGIKLASMHLVSILAFGEESAGIRELNQVHDHLAKIAKNLETIFADAAEAYAKAMLGQQRAA